MKMAATYFCGVTDNLRKDARAEWNLAARYHTWPSKLSAGEASRAAVIGLERAAKGRKSLGELKSPSQAEVATGCQEFRSKRGCKLVRR
jgi:hypothetical protein